MIKLNKSELRDKIYACWIGKNIGGTLGTPYEGQREVNDCKGFTTKAGKPLPNDDLDLQIVWFKAFKEIGEKHLDSKVLGEYWLEYVTPFWNEYGISKANMRQGVIPPISGQYKNYWKHSNGAWIRTEIWASLYPGNVDKAIKFAYEDASVDHGNGEGTYAAIFVEAVESAAFVINDLRTLLEIGLSKIPSDSKMHKFITKTIECYDNKIPWQETRQILTQMSLDDPELGWFQAPTNVGYTVLALLYGEGKFKETLLIACNCGDDTDCTCATAGSILGIMHGTKIIPEDWKAHIGDAIITKCINLGVMDVPESCAEFCDEIMQMHTITTFASDVIVTDAETDLSEVDAMKFMGNEFALSLKNRKDYYLEYRTPMTECLVEFDEEPEIVPNGTHNVKISLKQRVECRFASQKIYTVNWFLPEGWSVNGKSNIYMMNILEPAVGEFVLTAGEKVDAKNTALAHITCEGHFDTITIPVVLFG